MSWNFSSRLSLNDRTKVHVIEIEQQAEFPLSLNDRTKVYVQKVEQQAEFYLIINRWD